MGGKPAFPPDALAGRRVLIVEDELLIALEVKRCVEQLGGTVLGPAESLKKALELLAQATPDVALLDVNLRGKHITPAAQLCNDRGIPFILVTGYGRLALEEPLLQSAPRVWKPFDAKEIGKAIFSRDQ